LTIPILKRNYRHVFDFVEDLADDGAPTESTALLVAAARRDYFLVVQKGVASGTELTSSDLPASGEAFEEIPYLPRIIAKAEAKLRGELHPDMMFGCGGDRRFLAAHGDLNPADFLRQIWAADGKVDDVVSFIKKQS